MSENNFANAFLSCSLRPEDIPFIDLVQRILIAHKVQPFGTVGLFDAAPVNIAEHMKLNIPLADVIVIVATPRYIQKDIQSGKVSYGVSEMVHVETGMAYMANKPVIVFVQEGTDIGNFLPNVTQYILLNGLQEDLNNKWGLINSLIGNACRIVEKIKSKEGNDALIKLVTTGLAIIGGITIIESINSD